ncbi:MAG: AAA family ATPase [Acidimicrobiales bacterium]
MEPSYIEEVRLTAFKSFVGAALPLEELTLLIGRNGSGKSNALDGLRALARMAEGDVRDALDGGRDGPAVRGGAAGCAPLGESSFSLGCTVRSGGEQVGFDVVVQTEPEVRVVQEQISTGHEQPVLESALFPDSNDLQATWTEPSGATERLRFRSSRLMLTQVLGRVPATTAGRAVHRGADQILAALRGVFVLDPVPERLRQYVRAGDTRLRRNAENLSAVVGALLDRPDTAARISQAMNRLNEQPVTGVELSRSELDDVMLTLVERFAGHEQRVAARMMSDGSLRFLAILVALLEAPPAQAADPDEPSGQTTLVIEELENGLHASQAAVLVELIREEVARRRVRALATAHSPALLDAFTGEQHRGVVVCERDAEGRSTLTRLVDMPGYLDVVLQGSLGRAAVADAIHRHDGSPVSAADALDEVLRGRSG